MIKWGLDVVLVSGVSVKRNRELLDGRWDKHDTKDSANVADLISQGKCLFYEYPPMALRDLRNLLSLKRRLKKQEHGLKVRIRNHLLARYFPELDRYYGRSGSEGLAIVRWCLNPSVIAGLQYDQFVRLVAPGSRRIAQHKRLKAIWLKAVDSIGCDVGEAVEFEAKVMVEGLKQIRQAILATNDKIEDETIVSQISQRTMQVPKIKSPEKKKEKSTPSVAKYPLSKEQFVPEVRIQVKPEQPKYKSKPKPKLKPKVVEVRSFGILWYKKVKSDKQVKVVICWIPVWNKKNYVE